VSKQRAYHKLEVNRHSQWISQWIIGCWNLGTIIGRILQLLIYQCFPTTQYFMLTTTVAVLSNDVTMATLWRNAETFTDQKTETTRVEHRSTSNDTVMRKSTELPRDVGQDINCTQTTSHSRTFYYRSTVVIWSADNFYGHRYSV